jgi:hypothetical protein
LAKILEQQQHVIIRRVSINAFGCNKLKEICFGQKKKMEKKSEFSPLGPSVIIYKSSPKGPIFDCARLSNFCFNHSKIPAFRALVGQSSTAFCWCSTPRLAFPFIFVCLSVYDIKC